MNPSSELKPVKSDALVVLAVLALAILCAARFWPPRSDGGAIAVVVSIDGVEADRFALSDTERVYTNNGYTLRVRASSEGVRVAEADCPTRDCVHTGTISRAGQSVVCLPARVVIALEGVRDGCDVIAG